GAALDDAALVLGDGAEGASAEAAALDGHREADHFVGGDVGLAVKRVRLTPVGPLVYPIHLPRRERNGWRVEPDVQVPMALHQRTSVAWVGFQMQDAGSMRVQHGV